MRILRISLVTLLLGPLGACMVNARGGAGTMPPPGPGEPAAPRGASIEGTVIDARTHAPIAQADVDILEMNHNRLGTAKTGPDGRFESGDVPPGRYILNVKRNNYEAQSHQGVELHPGPTHFDFALNPK